MWPVLGEFTILAGVVVVAGTVLAHCADKLAEITRLGRLLVGSVLLAGATSLPELTVDVAAVRSGMADLAAGDLLGSSLMNLLILAILDLSYHSRGKMLSREAAGHALSGTMSIALTSLVGVALLTVGQSPNWSLLDISPPSWAILVAYLFGVRMVFLDQRISARAAAEAVATPDAAPVPTAHPPLWKPALGFLLAATVLVFAGPRMAHVAGQLADLSGLGKTFVGTTLVALSTSLPELVATITAVRMKAFDLAIGNIFGSNTFNMILFVPLDACHSGSLFAAIAPTHAVTCLAVVATTSIAVMGQLYHVERRWRMLEPDALLMIVVLMSALYLVYRLSV